MTVRKTKDMPPYPETFWAAIGKGVRDIKGKLCPLNAPEKRQLLAILRERDDCPEGWKNMATNKQHSIVESLRQAIVRLLDPEKAKAESARKNAKRRDNGKQEATIKKYKENGQQKIWDDRKSAKIREANARAILANQDHHEPTWDEATLERLAIDTVEMIVEKCGPDGFVHVCGGAWPGMTVNEAAEAECFGKGGNRHAVFIDDTNGRKFVRYRDVSTHVELFTPYSGTNCLNADELEKRVQTKLIDMGWPQHRRMFVHAGKGSCKGKRAAKIPFPYYTGVLVCDKSMEQIGIRLATKKDHAPKRKRSSSSL
jgi:hypothetical protein